MSSLSPDQDELIKLLLSSNVDFLVIGAHALGRHVAPRFTEDMDVWLRPSAQNGARVREALKAFGLTISEADAASFGSGAKLIRIGAKPHQVDLLTHVAGLEFDGSFERGETGMWGTHSLKYLSLEDLLASKKAVKRPKDLGDIHALEQKLARLASKKT